MNFIKPPSKRSESGEASQAFKSYRHTSPEQRALFLEAIADELDARIS